MTENQNIMDQIELLLAEFNVDTNEIVAQEVAEEFFLSELNEF